MVTSRMKLFLALGALGGPAGAPSAPLQESQRRPVQVEPTPFENGLRSWSVAKLLAEMPADPWASRGSEWVLHPIVEELRRRAEAGELSGDEWRTALLSADVIHTRTRWPVGEPLKIWIREPAWLRRTRITARAIEPDLGQVSADNLNPSRCGNCSLGRSSRQRDLRLDAVPEGMSWVTFELTIERRGSLDRSSKQPGGVIPLWNGWIALPIRAVPSFEDALPASSTAEEAVALRASLSAYLHPADEEDPSCWLNLQVGGSFADFPALRGLGLGLELQFRRADAQHGTLFLAANHGLGFWEDRSQGMLGFKRLDNLSPKLALAVADPTGLELVVVGRPRGVLSIWEADRWWSGELVIPLTEALANAAKEQDD